MAKYPISKEFGLFAHFTPPFRTPETAGRMGSKMKPPRWLWKDRELSVRRESIPGWEGAPIEVLVIKPRDKETRNCLVYYHGGGFLLGAAGYHYKNAKQYALRTPCTVIFVQYRLAPAHPFPIPVEDSFCALKWTADNADALGIDPERMAVGGDSAGGALAAAVSRMALERMGMPLRFQLLIYPVTDLRMDSDSNRRFTDTPMWNSTLSRLMEGGYLKSWDVPDLHLASPMEAESFAGLPEGYIETAQFDCLHDDGTGYAQKLRDAGIAVTLNETVGTMHGFDIVQKAPTTKAAVEARIRYMRERFRKQS